MGDKKEVGEGEAGEYVRTAGQAENKAEREESCREEGKGREEAEGTRCRLRANQRRVEKKSFGERNDKQEGEAREVEGREEKEKEREGKECGW